MRRALFGIALFLLGAGGIARPSTLEQDFPTEGMMRWGPFRVSPYLLLKDTGYDNNVFLDDTNPVGDFTSTGEAGLRLITFFSDRAALLAEEKLDYVWFAQTTDQNHFNNAFRTRANIYLRKLTYFAELQSLSIKERPSTAEFDFRIRLYTSLLGMGARYERPRSSLEVRLGRDRYRYVSDTPEGENIPDAQNRAENRLTVTGREKVLRKTTFLLEWEGRGIQFDDEHGQQRDSRSSRISAGFEFDPTGFLRGAVKIGRENLIPESPTVDGTPVDDFHGLVGEGILLYRMTNRTNLEGRGRRNIGFTISPHNVFYIYSAYGATLTQFLTARVAGEIGFDHEQVGYPEPTDLCSVDGECVTNVLRTDYFRSFFAGASYRFSNQTRMGLRLGGWRRTSTIDFLDRRRNTAMVTYAYNF